MSQATSIQDPCDGRVSEEITDVRSFARMQQRGFMLEDLSPPPNGKERRGRFFWKLQGIGWGGATLLAILFSVIDYMPWYDAIILGGLRTFFGFLITCGLRYLYRPVRRYSGNVWLTAVAVFFFCGLVALVDGITIILAAQAIGTDLTIPGLKPFLITSIFMRWMLYWLWSVFYFSISYWLDNEEARLRLSQAEAAARSSELQVLRAQVNPHFLFNALNSIMAESENPASVRDLTQALSEYLRFSLQQQNDIQKLGVELDALENYLRVEKTRFEDNLEYYIDAEFSARNTQAPIALVQPLLDNAIKYGQRSSIRPLRVVVSAVVSKGKLTIGVINSGHWIPPGTLPSTGTGLANLRRRLHLLYGEAATLTIETDEEGVRLCVQLPIPEEEK